jgi:exonuclease VII small subunit
MVGVILSLLGVLLLVSPAEVAPVVELQGFYIEPGAPVSSAAVEEAVAEARFAGGNLHIVVLADEPVGGATVFADGVLNELPAGGTVFVVAPETLGWTSIGDIYTEDQLNNATNVAFGGSSDTEVVQLFASELTGEPVGDTSSSRGGGGGWILLLVVGGLIAVVGFFVWRSGRKQKERSGARLDAAKAEVQKLLDAVANDILELEDEVMLSDNEEAQDHYERASATYAAAEKRLEQATKPLDLLELSNDLDVAIWELDCAEAVLDATEKPPKPEPRRPEPAPQPTPQPRPAPAPGSGYSRRPNRRSSYMNRDMLNAILMAGAAVATSRRWGSGPSRSSSAPSSGRSSGSRSGSSSSRRMRGGGRRRR